MPRSKQEVGWCTAVLGDFSPSVVPHRSVHVIPLYRLVRMARVCVDDTADRAEFTSLSPGDEDKHVS